MVFISCKKNTVTQTTENIQTDSIGYVTPINPYSLIQPVLPPLDTCLDPNSLLCIQKNIFQLKCANPGCHDGHFEPDFRTAQSSYSTLVYHPIVKNNTAGSFRYRVVPFDTAQSVLHERITNCCFVNNNDRMPQDNIGQPLPQEDIQRISQWIMQGAPDPLGHINTYPNKEPFIVPYYFTLDAASYSIAYSTDTNRVDSIAYNPFYAPNNELLAFFFLAQDDSTQTPSLLLKTLSLSTQKDDFSNPIASYTGNYFMDPGTGDEFFICYVNPATLPQNQILYMRFTVNDGDHPQNTFFPTPNLLDPYKTYWSFIVRP